MDEPPAESRTVLLTGANGFLGRFMCLEWLERLATADGKVDLPGPRRRPARRQLAGSPPPSRATPSLEQRFRELSAGHLEVVVGDVAEPASGRGRRHVRPAGS